MSDPDVYRADDISIVAEGYRPAATRIHLDNISETGELLDAYFDGYPQLLEESFENDPQGLSQTQEIVTDDNTVSFSRQEADPDGVHVDRDVMVEMRDGTELAVNVYRPPDTGQIPALLAWGMWGKDAQETVFWLRETPQPYQEAPFWDGGLEAGDTPYLVSHGFAHVVPDPRGIGDSQGAPVANLFDLHNVDDIQDTITWIAEQPWCDGRVGMIGPSSYAFSQALVGQDPPDALEALFPNAFWYTGEYTFTGMRDASLYNIFHGGHMYDSTHPLAVDSYDSPMTIEEMDEEGLNALREELYADPDIKYNSKFYTVFEYPMKDPMAFDLFINEWFHPHAPPGDVGDIEVPTYVGAVLPGGAHHRIYWEAFEAWEKIGTPDSEHKLMILPPGELARPFVDYHDEIARWNDARLRDAENGIMDEPPVKTFVTGLGKWAFEDAWPPSRVDWTEFYLQPNGSLGNQSIDSETVAWHQPIPLEDSQVYCLRFGTELDGHLELMGPIELHLRAAIDEEDTNWIADLVDVAPDGSRQLISQGWLRASYRGVDTEKSTTGWPVHTMDQQEIEPGAVYDYQIAMAPTAAVVKEGHTLELVLRNQDDMASQIANRGVYFLPLMREVTHTVHLDGGSYLHLPVTGRGAEIDERIAQGQAFD